MVTRASGSPAEAPAGTPRDRLRREGVRLHWWVKAHGYLDRAGGAESCTLLVGSARSGTTWLGEMLDRHHNHRVIFEPFKPGVIGELLPFDTLRYLPPACDDAVFLDPVQRLLTGKFRNGWTDHTNRALLPRRRLVKEVRVNCLAPWLAAHFPRSPIVLMVRHPLAVVASRQQLGWTTALQRFAEDAALRELLSPAQELLLQSPRDLFEAAVTQWALESWIPLQGLREDQVRVVLYEELAIRPREIGDSVLRWVGQQPDHEFEHAVSRPSRTSRPGAGSTSAAEGGPGPFDRRQRDRARRILEAFALDTIYDVESGHPRREALARWGHRVI